jgi:hypothetical protein
MPGVAIPSTLCRLRSAGSPCTDDSMPGVSIPSTLCRLRSAGSPCTDDSMPGSRYTDYTMQTKLFWAFAIPTTVCRESLHRLHYAGQLLYRLRCAGSRYTDYIMPGSRYTDYAKPGSRYTDYAMPARSSLKCGNIIYLYFKLEYLYNVPHSLQCNETLSIASERQFAPVTRPSDGLVRF